MSRHITRRTALGALGATALAASAPTPAFSATRPFIAYTPGAFFTSPTLGAPINTTRTAAFRTLMKTHPDQRSTAYPLIRGTSGNAWGTAYAYGTATDPVWKLAGTVPAACADLKTTGFRAPAWLGQMLTGTSDSPFVVIDTGTGQSVWGAKAVWKPGTQTITVGASGRFKHATNGLDRRNPRSDGRSNERSRGAIPDAMVIRKDLIDYGVANSTDLGHVLHLFMVETKTTDGHCHPMVGHESSKNGFGAEGERIAIRADLDLTTRGLSPEALVVARTLQRYGAYIGDNAGSKTALKAEQESSVRPVWGGRLPANALSRLSWDDFVVIERGWQ